MNFKNILISEKKTIKDLMKKITNSKIKTFLVINKNKKLVGSITDGDIRRFLSKHDKLNISIDFVANKKPIFIYRKDFKNKTKIRKISRKLEIIPILDSNGIVLDVIKNSEINLYTDYIENKCPVIIFAGGKGKRLLPLTKYTPKPMIKINKIPILETNIIRLKLMGFRNFYISVNYISKKIKDYFEDGHNFGVNITYIEEKKELGTAGSLSLVLLNSKVSKLPLLVMNGDLLTKLNFKRFINFHKKNNADLTVATREFTNQIPYGVMKSKNNKLLSIREKPINNFQVNAGMYVINSNILKFLEYGKSIDMPEFINLILKKRKKIMCYTVNDYWKDIGSLRDLDIAKSEYNTIFKNNEK